jgi:glutamate dehydrogenase/leucine dehydrogenase
MIELQRRIGGHTDGPAGDSGGHEIGCIFGISKRLQKAFTCVLTGKGIPFVASLI